MPASEQAIQYAKTFQHNFGKALIRPSGPDQITIRNILDAGRQLRDRQLWEFTILAEAVNVYVQLACSREWAVTGKLRAATRAVDWFNNAQSKDPRTGQTFYGFQQFEQRRALDALTIGRTSFAVEFNRKGESKLEYLDPSQLRFYRDISPLLNEDAPPVRDNELVWQYAQARNLRAGEVFLDHLLPIGTHYFISPLTSILPTARLYWLLQQHTSAQLDGRKVRDIFLISNEAIGDAIEDALIQQVALWSGADPTQIGVTVVSINNPTGAPVADQIATLGLSRLPENFDSKAFVDFYVNQIAAGLGMSLRQFWNADMTNRAMEEVQEQRQQQKGPNLFVRSEERLFNSTGVLRQFGVGVNAVRFGFIEESDASSRLTDAQVLKQTAEAAQAIQTVFGQTISPESFLSWMQYLRVLPAEMELSDMTAAQAMLTSQPGSPTPEQGVSEGNPAPSTFEQPVEKSKNLIPDYEQVTIDQDGHIIDKRSKVFSVLKLLLRENENAASVQSEPEITSYDAFQDAVNKANELNRQYFVENHAKYQEQIKQWATFQVLRSDELVTTATEKALAGTSLTLEEQDVIDTLVGYMTDEWEAKESTDE
jgi:hypothetical protein